MYYSREKCCKPWLKVDSGNISFVSQKSKRNTENRMFYNGKRLFLNDVSRFWLLIYWLLDCLAVVCSAALPALSNGKLYTRRDISR